MPFLRRQSPMELDLPLPDGAKRVRVLTESGHLMVEIRSENGEVLERHESHAPSGMTRWRAVFPVIAFWLALALYLAVRLTSLADFPVYFFTDEAIQTMLAADLIRDGFRGYTGEFLPTYFPNGGQYNLSLSVYLQVIPNLLFPRSVEVTRATSVLMTLIAALAVGLIGQKIFASRYPWLVVLVLSLTPAWFLHSRTAFETALATTFFAAFLYLYLLYLSDHSLSLPWAVTFAALTFYSYAPMRLVIAMLAVLLVILDWRRHWQNPRITLISTGLGILWLIPFVRFLVLHPAELNQHLTILGSYWVADLSLVEKLRRAGEIYLNLLSPAYWWGEPRFDIIRHVMKGYGHLPRLLAPFTILGFLWALVRMIRGDARAKTLLLAWVAGPLGAVLVGEGITRVLCMVIPLTLFTALGLEKTLEVLKREHHWRDLHIPALVKGNGLLVVLYLALAWANVAMLNDALSHAALWTQDYGLNGLQYGARQVFAEIQNRLKHEPDLKVVLTPTWANGTDVLARFFLPQDPPPVEINSYLAYTEAYRPFIPEKTVFVMTAEEYRELPRQYFSEIEIERELYYPDGSPGFYFVRLRYVPDFEEILAREQAERLKPIEETVEVNGMTLAISHTRLDMGELPHIFDRNPSTLIRTAGINPLTLKVVFPVPQVIGQVSLRIGGTPSQVKLSFWQAGENTPHVVEQEIPQDPLPRAVSIPLENPLEVSVLQIELWNAGDGADGHVHLWELDWSETP